MGEGAKFIPLNSYGKAEFMPKCSNKIHSPGKEQNLYFKADLLKAGKYRFWTSYLYHLWKKSNQITVALIWQKKKKEPKKEPKGQQGIKEKANKRKRGSWGQEGHLLRRSLLTTWSQCNLPVTFLPSQCIQPHKTKTRAPTHRVPQGRKTEALLCPLLTCSLLGFYWNIHPPCAFITRSSWTKPWTFPFCPVSSTAGWEGAALHHDGRVQIDHRRWWILEGLTAPIAIHFGKDHIFLIADPQISTVLWLTLVESKANFKCENIIAE